MPCLVPPGARLSPHDYCDADAPCQAQFADSEPLPASWPEEALCEWRYSRDWRYCLWCLVRWLALAPF